MAFHKGHEGKVTAASTDLATIEWSFTKKNRTAEVTNSGSGGVVKKVKTVAEYTGRVKCVWDSDAIPDVDLTLDQGDTVALKLYCGDSGKFYDIAALIEELTVTDNNREGVVEYEFTFHGNTLTAEPLT